MDDVIYIRGKSTAAILREGINAAGGADHDAVAKVKCYVDANYPGFPWRRHWATQIRGAKAGVCYRRDRARLTPTVPSSIQNLPPQVMAPLQAAVELLREVRAALAHDGHPAANVLAHVEDERFIEFGRLAVTHGDRQSQRRMAA